MSVQPEPLSGDAAMAEVTSAIESLQDGAGDTTPLSSVIVRQVGAAAAEPAKLAQLAHALVLALRSALNADTLLSTLTDAFVALAADEDGTVVLGTALLEVLDALMLANEDVDDFKDQAPPPDAEAAEKASAVVKGLLDKDMLPAYLANLVLTPSHLLPLQLHPTPRQPDILRRGLGRLNTSVHFKQRTTNLLRESSEGFSRLIVLLTGPVALYTDPETDEERDVRAKRVWDSVRDLIGYFNLAPIRVYDLVLEVASCHVEKHWRFFLVLLRKAGLGPKEEVWFARKPTDTTAETERITHALDVADTDDSMITRALAFRFRWYKKTDNGEMPLRLLFLTALLIKYGFVQPGRLLPALSPDDDGMADILKRFQGAMSSRSGTNNALVNSVLVDDEATEGGAATPAEIAEPPKPEAEQKIQLLQALLAVGESDFSLFLLAQYPWVVAAYPSIADLIIRNLGISLGPVYRATCKSCAAADLPPLFTKDPEVILTTSYPPPPSTMTTDWRFFYDHWADEIDVWSEIDDVHRKGERWFVLLKGLGAREPELMVRLCRIMTEHFRALRRQKIDANGFDAGTLTYDEKSQLFPTSQELDPWRGLIRHTVLPSLNVSEPVGAPFGNEVSELFNFFDWPTMASWIGEWRDSTTNLKARTAALPAAHAANQSTREVKQSLQRVTAAASMTGAPQGAAAGPQTADRGPARALAKHGHGNPLALWTTGNGQVMSYGSVGSIGEFFMEVARYSGPFSKEVAVFTWVDTLASNKNDKSIENLATFVGIINRQFVFTLDPILILVATGIKQHEPFALPLVEKLLTGMTGEDIVENHAISIQQLQSYASGPEMTREAFYSSENTCRDDRRPVRTRELIAFARRSVPRLVQALVDTRLAVPILVGLARLATEALLFEPGVPIKAMSDKKDRLAELGCADDIPSLTQLQGDGNLDEQLCWAILRPKLRARLAKDAQQNGSARNGMDVDTHGSSGWWPAALNETVEQVAAFLSSEVRAVLGCGFFVRFNSLRISDIEVSDTAYKNAHDNLAKILRQLQAMKPSKVVNSEIRRIKDRDAQLKSEETRQKAHVERVRAELQEESAHWFAKVVELGHDGALANQLHDHCLYLRAIQTPADAIFVARFVRLVHDLNAPGYSTIHAYMFFLQDKLASKLYECTESEARNLGRCLMLMMSDLDAWHRSPAKYYEEALGGPVPTEGEPLPEYTKQSMFVRTKRGEPKKPLLHDDFKNMLGKMHNGLTNALVTCWKDGVFYSPKNAVVIALQLLPFFPVMESNARKMENEVKALLARTDGSITPDMKPAFNSYLSQLKTRKLQRPCVPASQFYPTAAKQAKAAADKAKQEAAAKAAAEAEAKAKAEEEARAKEADEPKAEPDASPMDVDEAAKEDKVEAAANLPGSSAEAKALRAKLVQGRAAREAQRAAAAAEPRPAEREAAQAMAPPPEPSVEDARAAARARRFGALAPNPAANAPATPPHDSRSSTPRQSPGRERRAGTDDSRVSDRSRREHARNERGERDGSRDARREDTRSERERERERGERRSDARHRDDQGRRHEEPTRDPRAREERYRDDRRGAERPRQRSREDRHREHARGERRRDDRPERPVEEGGVHAPRPDLRLDARADVRGESRPHDDRRQEGAGLRPDERERRDDRRSRRGEPRDVRGGRDPLPPPPSGPRDAPPAAHHAERPRDDARRQDGRGATRDDDRRGKRRDERDGDKTPREPRSGRETPQAAPESAPRPSARERDSRPSSRRPSPQRAGAGVDVEPARPDPRDARDAREAGRRGRRDGALPDRQSTPGGGGGDAPERPQRGDRDRNDRDRPGADRGYSVRGSANANNASGNARELLPTPPQSAGHSLMARMGLAPGTSPRGDERDTRKRPLDSEGAPSSREGSPGTKRRRAGGGGGGGRRDRGGGERERDREQHDGGSGGRSSHGRMFANAMRQSGEHKK